MLALYDKVLGGRFFWITVYINGCEWHQSRKMKNNYNIKTTFFQTKLIPSQIRPSFLYKNRNLTEIKKIYSAHPYCSRPELNFSGKIVQSMSFMWRRFVSAGELAADMNVDILWQIACYSSVICVSCVVTH